MSGNDMDWTQHIARRRRGRHEASGHGLAFAVVGAVVLVIAAVGSIVSLILG